MVSHTLDWKIKKLALQFREVDKPSSAAEFKQLAGDILQDATAIQDKLDWNEFKESVQTLREMAQKSLESDLTPEDRRKMDAIAGDLTSTVSYLKANDSD